MYWKNMTTSGLQEQWRNAQEPQKQTPLKHTILTYFFKIAFIPMAIYKNLLVLEKIFQCSLSSGISSYREVAVEKALK